MIRIFYSIKQESLEANASLIWSVPQVQEKFIFRKNIQWNWEPIIELNRGQAWSIIKQPKYRLNESLWEQRFAKRLRYLLESCLWFKMCPEPFWTTLV